MKASMMFHPSDKSSRAMFYRAHDQIAARNEAICEMQRGPNPLSPDELRRAMSRPIGQLPASHKKTD